MMRMQSFLLLFFIAWLHSAINAQQLSNMGVEQQGKQVVVSYELQTDAPCEVTLLVSLDQGKTWSDALAQCSGSVGKNISSGRHSITWNVLAERTEFWGDGIRFRVKAIVMETSIDRSSSSITNWIKAGIVLVGIVTLLILK